MTAKEKEEIKKIVREYAENVKSEYVSAKLIETLVMGFYHSRLKTDYCIVPKSEILADYEFNAGCFAQFSASGDDRCNKIAQWHKGKCDELESLFGKDTFEEEGK